MSSSGFSPNMAPGRPNYYAPYQPRVAYPAPMLVATNPVNYRPPMGQSPQPSQPISEQAGGNSFWPLVLGGAALAGAVYFGYQWLNKPKAAETAETTEAIKHASEETLSEGAANSEATVAAKEAATETTAVSSAVSTKESKLVKGAVGAVEKETSTIVQDAERKVVQDLGNVGQSRLSNFARGAWNTATHRGTLATGAVIAGGIILDRFVPTLRPAIMAFGAEVPGMVWKSCEESAKQCTPGLAQRAGTSLANMAAGAGTALGTGYAAFKNYGSGLFSKVWNTCGETATKECTPGLLQGFGTAAKEVGGKIAQSGLNYIPTVDGIKSAANATRGYIPTVDGIKSAANATRGYLPTVDGIKSAANAALGYLPTVAGVKSVFDGVLHAIWGAKSVAPKISSDVMDEAVRLATEQVAKSGGSVSQKVGEILAARGLV